MAKGRLDWLDLVVFKANPSEITKNVTKVAEKHAIVFVLRGATQLRVNSTEITGLSV